VPVLEDKVVQRAMTRVLNAVYETEFKGFSYGFRPGRSAHMALDALAVGIRRHKVSWVLDADIRSFFDTLDHGWLMKFVEHRIGDRRVQQQAATVHAQRRPPRAWQPGGERSTPPGREAVATQPACTAATERIAQGDQRSDVPSSQRSGV
jgi:hypothetical protein